MADLYTPHAASTLPAGSFNGLTPELLSGLTPEQLALVQRLARERDHLILFQETLLAADAAKTLDERLQLFAEAIRRVGFGRTVITLRDTELNPTAIVSAGLSAAEERELAASASSGDIWRRRLERLEPYRVSHSYYLDARDEWVAREFAGGLPSQLGPGSDPTWTPQDALLVLLRGAAGRLLGTLVVDDPVDRVRPSLERVRTVELLAQQIAHAVEHAQLMETAQRRSARLQRLHEAGHALARSLEEGEIVREIARQAGRILPFDTIVIAHPNLERGTVTTSLRRVRGVERPTATQPLSAGPVATVARTGRPVRLDQYPPNYAAAATDPLGPSAQNASVLAVPMMIGVDLVGVLAVRAERRHAYTSEDEEVLLALAAQASTAIANARLYEASQREQRQTEALADIARAVGESLDLDEVLERILRHTVALLRCEGACVSLRAGPDEFECVAGVGNGSRLHGMKVPAEGSLTGAVARDGQYRIVNDSRAEQLTYRPMREAANVRRAVIVPLTTGHGTIGVLTVLNRDTEFTDTDARVLQRLADQVAVAIGNARLFEEHRSLAERHRLVIETARDAIVITDTNRHIAFANKAAMGLFGRGDALLGMPVRETLTPEIAEEVAERERRALAGEPQRYAAEITRPDGERRLVEISSAPLREGAEVTGIVACLRDVTDERRARDAVVQSEARYRNLFETASDAIYTLDKRGCFTSVNEATCAMSGYERADLLGRSCVPLLEAAEVETVTDHFRAALRGASPRYECHFVARTGERRLASVTNTPIRRGRAIVGVLGIARDITEERQRAAALARSEARYERLVETASDAIMTVDAEGRFTAVNRALEHSVGVPRDQLLGRPFVSVVKPEDRADTERAFERTLRGERVRIEFRYVHASGAVRNGAIITAPIVEGDRVVGGLGIVRDITDEKRLTEQLLQQEKLAAIGQLVSGVAHELNNPLAGVMALSQLLLASPATEAQRRSLDTIHQEARRAAKIVTNLLTFARQHAPERRPTSLNQVLLDTLELRRYALRVRQIEAITDLDPELPVTWADQFQLQQVVLNLLTNAEQALEEWSGARRIELRSRRERQADGGVTALVLTVADSGPGVPGGATDRIFNPFYTTKPVGRGTGLGLSISDGIVREHGGEIRVTSQPGAGATFEVVLPYVPPPDSAAAPAAGAAATDASGGRAPTGSILVADDEPSIRDALGVFLRNGGHDVTVVGTGSEALARLRERRYDALILDLRMPDMPGDAVYAELKARDPEQAARTIFLTGDVQSESARAFVRATGRPCLSKPFMLEELAAALHATLSAD